MKIGVDHAFSHDAFSLDGETHFLFEKYLFFRNDFGSPLIFVLLLKENKIRKKTISVPPYLEKTTYEKPNLGSGSGYLLGRYGKDRSTPLSP